MLPSWYRALPLAPSKFVECLAPLYDVLEGRHKSESKDDPFAREGWQIYHGLTEEQVAAQKKIIQAERAWTMRIGDFHQDVMGKFDTWETLEKGHATGCDLRKTDDSGFAEIKNNVNTMNSSSKEAVMRKLVKQKELGKRALLIIINGTVPHTTLPGGVEQISGRDFYEELTGRKEYMDDLLATFRGALANAKTLADLRAHLGL